MFVALLAMVAQQAGPTPHSGVHLFVHGPYVPGQPLSATVHIRLDEGWHTYWRNPGEAGTPTRVRWRLPEGWSVTGEQWSVPQRFADSAGTSIGYAHEAWIRFQLGTDAASTGPQKLTARVEYLVCADSCLPAEAEVSLTVAPDGERPGVAEPRAGGVFPRDLAARGQWWREAGMVRLRCPALEGAAPTDVELFAESPGLVDPAAAPVRAEQVGDDFVFAFAPAGFPDPSLQDVAFVMVGRDRTKTAVRFTARPRPDSRPSNGTDQ